MEVACEHGIEASLFAIDGELRALGAQPDGGAGSALAIAVFGTPWTLVLECRLDNRLRLSPSSLAIPLSRWQSDSSLVLVKSAVFSP